MIRKMMVIACLAVFFSGCAMGPKYTEPKPASGAGALVFFMNSLDFKGGAWGANFSINNKKIVNLHAEGYSWAYLKPGVYIVGASSLRLEAKIDSGRKYYFEYKQGNFSGSTYTAELSQLPPEKAEKIIKNFRYAESALEVIDTL